jgi:hypothetical protein
LALSFTNNGRLSKTYIGLIISSTRKQKPWKTNEKIVAADPGYGTETQYPNRAVDDMMTFNF